MRILCFLIIGWIPTQTFAKSSEDCQELKAEQIRLALTASNLAVKEDSLLGRCFRSTRTTHSRQCAGAAAIDCATYLYIANCYVTINTSTTFNFCMFQPHVSIEASTVPDHSPLVQNAISVDVGIFPNFYILGNFYISVDCRAIFDPSPSLDRGVSTDSSCRSNESLFINYSIVVNDASAVVMGLYP